MSAGETGGALLQQDGAGVYAPVRPEDGDAGLGLPVDDGPVDGAASPVQGEEGGVELDGAVRREVENPLRDDNRDKGQHVEVRSQVLVGLEELAAAQVFGLVGGDTQLLGQVEQGVSLALVEHPNHVFALLQESPVDRLAKGCLSNESHSHFNTP